VQLSTILPPSGEPVTIIAPHPDDEVLGVGGVMSRLVGDGHRLRLIAVTEGEAAFGRATPARRRELGRRRARERIDALERLGVGSRTEVVRFAFPDAGIAAVEEELALVLGSCISPVVLATWRGDGHPDHEAVGRASAIAAQARGARLFEYAVWAHLDPCWRPARRHRVQLGRRARSAKLHAIAAFDSQLGVGPGGGTVVPDRLVTRLRTAGEVLFG
jgi:LmbE family N-acetylglucosaminyl deacetylase